MPTNSIGSDRHINVNSIDMIFEPSRWMRIFWPECKQCTDSYLWWLKTASVLLKYRSLHVRSQKHAYWKDTNRHKSTSTNITKKYSLSFSRATYTIYISFNSFPKSQTHLIFLHPLLFVIPHFPRHRYCSTTTYWSSSLYQFIPSYISCIRYIFISIHYISFSLSKKSFHLHGNIS